jgi:FAD/FMN-containing dehydrogenase
MERARDVLRFYSKFVEGAPDELTLFAALGAAPDGTPVALLLVGYFGPLEEGERILRPLREFGPPILDAVKPTSYVDLQGILAPGYPPGVRNYWKSGFLADLNEEAIDTMVRHFERVPSKRTSIVLEYLRGAVSRVGERDTAFGHRDARFDLVITSIWPDSADDEVNVAWTRGLWHAMEPFASGAVYVNYLGAEQDEGAERVRAAYDPEKYERLVSLKRKYDPENLFRMNQNIPP